MDFPLGLDHRLRRSSAEGFWMRENEMRCQSLEIA